MNNLSAIPLAGRHSNNEFITQSRSERRIFINPKSHSICSRLVIKTKRRNFIVPRAVVLSVVPVQIHSRVGNVAIPFAVYPTPNIGFGFYVKHFSVLNGVFPKAPRIVVGCFSSCIAQCPHKCCNVFRGCTYNIISSINLSNT